MGRKQREEVAVVRRTREELAQHFMKQRLKESERLAEAYRQTLDPRERD
jgi:hypothetical protein